MSMRFLVGGAPIIFGETRGGVPERRGKLHHRCQQLLWRSAIGSRKRERAFLHVTEACGSDNARKLPRFRKTHRAGALGIGLDREPPHVWHGRGAEVGPWLRRAPNEKGTYLGRSHTLARQQAISLRAAGVIPQ